MNLLQVLTKCLSYDEIKLSAMMAMSSHTEFINNGSRDNEGVVSTDPDSVQPRGVIIGVVGSRFFICLFNKTIGCLLEFF